tara:strand:+ start:117514 stop:117858 length:345 start_codon:yes stop_codon:yes gene_type:complete
MFYKTRFLLSLLVLCTALVACGDNNSEAPQATNPEATVQEQDVTTATTLPEPQIETGMSEQAVTNLLGTPTLTQTHTLDTMTLIHSEWTNAAGTTSVQFLNDKVQFSQFTPVDK